MAREKRKVMIAQSPEEVRCFIETHPVNKTEWNIPAMNTFIMHSGNLQFRIPEAIKDKCFVTPGDQLDQRMYRWDNIAEWKHLMELREREEKAKAKTKAKAEFLMSKADKKADKQKKDKNVSVQEKPVENPDSTKPRSRRKGVQSS